MNAGLDYDYAPRSYWPGAWATELSTTKGSFARWARQGFAPEDRPAFGGSPFSVNAGEYLPELNSGEVEIARIELASATGDVKSVRARTGDNGLIYYRVVDEYDLWTFQVHPEVSPAPLAMRDLISLIDSAEWHPGEGQVEIGLTDAYRDGNLDGGSPAELESFVTVTSVYYPGLHDHYRRDAQRWVEEILIERWGSGFECECGLTAADSAADPNGHRAGCRTFVALKRSSERE